MTAELGKKKMPPPPRRVRLRLMVDGTGRGKGPPGVIPAQAGIHSRRSFPGSVLGAGVTGGYRPAAHFCWRLHRKKSSPATQGSSGCILLPGPAGGVRFGAGPGACAGRQDALEVEMPQAGPADMLVDMVNIVGVRMGAQAGNPMWHSTYTLSSAARTASIRENTARRLRVLPTDMDRHTW